LSNSAIDKINTHEELCLLRYDNIEKRLKAGTKRFDRLETMMWGIYPFMLGCLALAKFT
jgi:hypothetical protein